MEIKCINNGLIENELKQPDELIERKRVKEDLNNKPYTIFLIAVLIMVVSGVFGFLYETIFYRIDLGYFVKRGATIGPWLPIYAFGGLLITFATLKFKNKPWLVFISNCLTCGILEFVTGYLLYNISNVRLWDYNTEIWNFGNIGGYICLRSIMFFGISGLFLVYVITPFIKSIALKTNKVIFSTITLTLGILFIADFICNNIL